MADYTELVKFLRGLSPWAFPDASKNRMNDAAAAIEELSKTVRDLTTKVECSPMQISGKAFDRAIEAWNEKERKAVQDGQ